MFVCSFKNMGKFNIKEKENVVEVSADTEIYSMDAIYSASYNLLDRAYIILDGDSKKTVKVSLKGKEKLDKNKLEELADTFFNELISSEIRIKISNKNRLVREYIISAALVGASPELRKKLGEETVGAGGVDSSEDSWDDDPLGIAVSWEAKYKKEGEEGDE